MNAKSKESAYVGSATPMKHGGELKRLANCAVRLGLLQDHSPHGASGELLARQVGSALYHLTTAVAMA